MRLNLLRRSIVAAAAVAVAGAGLVAIPSALAGDAAAATCTSSSTVKKTLIVDYGFQKAVAPQTAQSGTATYSLSVSTSSIGNPYVQGIWDIPPTELKDVKPTVKVKAFTLIGGILGGGGAFDKLINEQVIDPANVKQDGRSWKINHTGWAVYSGQALTAEFSYKLPASIMAGKQLQSGGAAFQATPKPPLGYLEFPNLTACTTVRAPNAGEAITGSLDSAGLGSSEGQLSSTGSLADLVPAIIGGAIGG
ncbi:hypothetical protein [Gordonia neofelifaecis]|uniref:Uncharacterized protein n=1 Tax=Gordonia neofelifaecis NRRL B-59395 TaxID=644548 RepID=F1YFX1_9ACTN|nr:hypothetical protein [Gordonia neofelifaecis]EGD56548.1 hypothetical protein SCNU_03317 [Gordonia neofelifaecis NRRL B-59395]